MEVSRRQQSGGERIRLTEMRMVAILAWIHLGFLAKASTNTRHQREGVNPSSGHASSWTPLGSITCQLSFIRKDCLLAKPQPFGDNWDSLCNDHDANHSVKLCDRSPKELPKGLRRG